MVSFVSSGRNFVGDDHDFIYRLLEVFQPGLMLDVGAAAGQTSKLMLEKSPRSSVIAFEPFPGNMPYFERTIGDDPRVELRSKAVGERNSTASFEVPSTVKGTESNWTDFHGYSSVGYLTSDELPKAVSSIEVEVCRIDDEVEEHVRFMKVDVQGGELAVLRGADRTIKEAGIDVIFLEFTGQKEILRTLDGHGYHIFDSPYLIVPRKLSPRNFFRFHPLQLKGGDIPNWTRTSTVNLSTGHEAYYLWPNQVGRSFDKYCDFFRDVNRKIGFVQTDLICVHEDFLAAFYDAVSQVLLTSDQPHSSSS